MSETDRRVDELAAGLERILAAPADGGRIEMIVRRPAVDGREVVEEAELSTEVGLVGDGWISRPSSRTDDGSPHPDMQLTLMSSRVIELLAGERNRWPLAGDQIYVDLDLGEKNLPVGTRLGVGEAVVEITAQPHLGCGKFAERFGREALLFVNGRERRSLRLRGVNARVVRGGTVRVGDVVAKIDRAVE